MGVVVRHMAQLKQQDIVEYLQLEKVLAITNLKLNKLQKWHADYLKFQETILKTGGKSESMSVILEALKEYD
jgi:hypothetical protein